MTHNTIAETVEVNQDAEKSFIAYARCTCGKDEFGSGTTTDSAKRDLEFRHNYHASTGF